LLGEISLVPQPVQFSGSERSWARTLTTCCDRSWGWATARSLRYVQIKLS